MIISFASLKGGCGKSTLAFQMQYYLSEYFQYKSAVLLDMDVQQTVSYANKLRNENYRKLSTKSITGNQLEKVLKISDKDNLFIIDNGGYDSASNRQGILLSDLVIVPVSDKVFDILGLHKFESILEELSYIKSESLKKKCSIYANVVINNVSPNIKNNEDLRNLVKKSKFFKLMETVIRQRVDIPYSSGKGLSVEEYNKNSKANDELKSLANEICNNLKII